MEFIEVSVQDRIAFITLNRPDKRNALHPAFITELTTSLKEAEASADVKVIVIKAAGEAFSAGADLAYLQQLQNNTYQENLKDSVHLEKLFLTMYNLEKLIIAQVEGNAIAGGCGLVTACDIVFAVPEALFGYSEVKIGFVPALVAAFTLRKIGEGRTRELLLSGDLISAQLAREYGLVNFLQPATDIAGAVQAYAEKIVNSTSQQSIKTTKALLARIQSLSMAESLSHAAEVNAEARLTPDCKKGIDAFLNKKQPKW
jgi:methylglutaconyl-CoA hydratase